MPGLIAALTLIVLMGMVISRVILLRTKGIEAFHFGNLDKKDFLIPPFAVFYFYLIFAAAFGSASLSSQRFFESKAVAWVGVVFCLAALALFLWSLVSFGRSFRVGIDTDQPDKLVTSGAFARSRNPIYVAFILILSGQFLVFPNWILMVYLVAGVWIIHRQILREEDFLRGHYGREYSDYCNRVRRYL